MNSSKCIPVNKINSIENIKFQSDKYKKNHKKEKKKNCFDNNYDFDKINRNKGIDNFLCTKSLKSSKNIVGSKSTNHIKNRKNNINANYISNKKNSDKNFEFLTNEDLNMKNMKLSNEISSMDIIDNILIDKSFYKNNMEYLNSNDDKMKIKRFNYFIKKIVNNKNFLIEKEIVKYNCSKEKNKKLKIEDNYKTIKNYKGIKSEIDSIKIFCNDNLLKCNIYERNNDNILKILKENDLKNEEELYTVITPSFKLKSPPEKSIKLKRLIIGDEFSFYDDSN